MIDMIHSVDSIDRIDQIGYVDWIEQIGQIESIDRIGDQIIFWIRLCSIGFKIGKVRLDRSAGRQIDKYDNMFDTKA